MVAVAAWRGRGSLLDAMVCGATACVAVGVVAWLSRSTLPSYGQHPRVHYSVPVVASMIGSLLVVDRGATPSARAAGPVPGRAPGRSRAGDGGSRRRRCPGLRGGSLTGAAFRPTAWARCPGCSATAPRGSAASASAAGSRRTCRSPIPLLSGNLGLGLVTGGAWPVAYLLLVVPLLRRGLAGRRQLRGTVEPREWAEFGRAAVCNAGLWLVLAEATRLRFSGRIGPTSSPAAQDWTRSRRCSSLRCGARSPPSPDSRWEPVPGTESR